MASDLREGSAPAAHGDPADTPALPRFRAIVSAAAIAVGICLSLLDVLWNRSGLVALILACAWLGASRLAPRETARRWADLEHALVPLAFLLRGAFILICFSLKEARGVLTYNVDVRSFIYWAQEIVDGLPSLLDIRPFDLAGTYDVGFQYFLAFVLWLPGGSLLAAQVLVALAGTASVYLLYRVARPLLGRSALLCGLLLAIAPNAVFIASADLMKDSVLTFGFLLAIFAGQRLYASRRLDAVAVVSLAVGFVIARSIRVYVAALLECGLVALPLFAWWRARRAGTPWRIPVARVALVLGIFLGAEGVLLFAVREPPVAFEMGRMPGWLRLPSSRSAFFGPRGKLEALLELERAGVPREENGLPAGKGFLQRYVFELLRRLYGPFLWTPPVRDHAFKLLMGNWTAWLEAPLWYALFPFGLFGIFVLARRGRWDAWFLAGSVAAFFLILVVFSVTHRQRTSNLLPLLSITAVAGWNALSPRRRRVVLLSQAAIVGGLAAVYWSVKLLHRV